MPPQSSFKNFFKFINPLILFSILAAQIHLGWQKWADLTLDYGRELYVPWRLSCGDVLYKDIYVLFGPLSYYWNSFLFHIFGPSIKTLVIFNIFLVVLFSFIIYRIFAYISGHWAAFLTTFTFLTLFAFNQFYKHQGFNYICPYTYSLTYALFLSLLTIMIFISYCQFPRSIKRVILMGFTIGLISLTRLEIFFALLAAISTGIVLRSMLDKSSLSDHARIIIPFILAILTPIVITIAYFSQYLPHEQLWPSVFSHTARWKEIFSLYFYQYLAGLDKPRINLLITLHWALNDMAYILGLACWGLSVDTLFNKKKPILSVALFLAGLGAIYCLLQTRTPPHQLDFFRGLPILVLIVMLYSAGELFFHRFEQEMTVKILPKLVLAIFAFLLLLKIFLNVRIIGSGFVLGMPGILLAVMFVGDFALSQVPQNQAARIFVQIIFSVTWLMVLYQPLHISYLFFKKETSTIAEGGNKINYDQSKYGKLGNQMGLFLEEINQIVPKDAGFIVFPDGIMLNFLSHRKSPLPYTSYMPAEMTTYQEENILKKLKEKPPSIVILNNVDNLKDYGYKQLGKDYAPNILGWILKNYQPISPPTKDASREPTLSIYKLNPHSL